MTISVEAVYENGVLIPDKPLPLAEREKVRITLDSIDSPLLRAYGIMGWTGSSEELERLIMDPEFDPLEAP